MSQLHDVQRSARRRELHDQAAAAGVEAPASLALALGAAEGEGWRVAAIATRDGRVIVEFGKVVRPMRREELAEHVRELRRQGLSYRMIARRLERDGVAAPHGGARWYPSSVRWVAQP
jgi:hypothetical protein